MKALEASDLSAKQKELLLYLGGEEEKDDKDRVIAKDVFKDLLSLNIVHELSDGNFDLTKLGERLYEQLAGK